MLKLGHQQPGAAAPLITFAETGNSSQCKR
jgi:hypothetical protein